MKSPEEVALGVLGECAPCEPHGHCATHNSPLGGAPTCLHVLHLTEAIRARDEEVRSEFEQRLSVVEKRMKDNDTVLRRLLWRR